MFDECVCVFVFGIIIGGQTALALRLLLAVFSSKLSSVADRPFGDEVLLENPQDIRFL